MSYKKTLEYLKGRLRAGDFVLDVGQKSPMSFAMIENIGVYVYNTIGDLDGCFDYDKSVRYNAIVYSHTIEHQFNPLITLLRLRNIVERYDISLFIITPDRGKLLWSDGHFNEIDVTRMHRLIERAGMEINSTVRQKVWRPWWNYLLGFRAFFRLFF